MKARPTQSFERDVFDAWTGVALTVALATALLPGVARAEPPPEQPAVPAPLAPWVPWVLHDHRSEPCTAAGGERLCTWPGRLGLRVDRAGGTFKLDVWLDRPGRVNLPGDARLWPLGVTDDRELPTLRQDEDGRPWVRLSQGLHVLVGHFDWSRPPEVLTVPPEVGVITLVVDGKTIDGLRRQDDRLWLQQGGGDRNEETDSLRVSVHRQLRDGVPLRVTTRLELKVAGRTRDAALGKVLLAGGRPVQVRSELPVQVAPDGSVRAHIRPGSHRIEIDAVYADNPKQLTPPKPGPGFDAAEVWLWLPDETLRSVELSGLTAVDPERTALGSDWRGGPTWMARQGEQLKLQIARRGLKEPPPSRPRLQRELWLDLDGAGLSARDSLSGEMHRDWRLDWAGNGVLGRVHDTGAGQDLLITTHPESKRPGAELRRGKLNLRAELRVPLEEGSLQAVGWGFDAQNLSATLHLPPGWRLLGASGVDHMPGTWLASWTLFDFFGVLMVALGTARLFGWRWGMVALAALVLSHGEEGTPQWVWLNLLAAVALVRVLPTGAVWWRRLAQAWRALVVLSLVLILVPFAIGQIRHGMYPQTGEPGTFAESFGMVLGDKVARGEQLSEADDMEQTKAQAPSGKKWSKRNLAKSMVSRKGDSSGDYLRAQQQLQQVDPNAVVQTGAGLPDWRWSQWQLMWSGPVQRDHQIKLWLVPPGINLVLALLRVALLVALALALCEPATWRRWLIDLSDGSKAPGAEVAKVGLWLLAAALAALLLTPSDSLAKSPNRPQRQQVQSDVNNPINQAVQSNVGAIDAPNMPPSVPIGPPADLLATLRDRLLAATACDGPCVTVSTMSLTVRQRQVALSAEVHAQRLAAWALPGPLDALAVSQVKVDGQVTDRLRRAEGGLLQVQLSSGRHKVEVLGQLGGARVVTLRFDASGRPHRLVFDGPGWRIDGLDESGVPDDSVQLARQASASQADSRVDVGQSELPAWFTVERRLLLGLPWNVHTVVRRATSERPQLVKIPLLSGEAVLTAGVRVEDAGGGDRLALVSMARGADRFEFDSELAVAPTVRLTSPLGKPWTEDWTVICSPIWRCAFDGPAPVQRETADGDLEPRWQPWPGESLTVGVERPEEAAGQAVTVDRVDYRVAPGQRLLEASLELRVRASQGGWRKIGLPAGAELQKVEIDGKARQIRPDAKGVVHLPLSPGEQRITLRWQQPWERSLIERPPAVDLGGPAVNARLRIALGEERWLLWASGPSWGPAVLFWSHLFVFALLAILLGRFKALGVRTWQWLLLGLGFVQLPALVLLIVVGWFAAMALRQRVWTHRLEPRWVVPFNLGQVALVGYTVVALICLYAAIHTNLLLDLDMQVSGANSTNSQLIWYVDRVASALPSAAMISLPVWVWRCAMLGWSLWLVWALLRWLPWAWRCFGDGGLWRRGPAPQRLAPQAARPAADTSGAPIPPPPPATE